MLRGALSHERLDSYRQDGGETDLDLLARYAWNMGLCEALYPLLQGLEIALRNSIHSAVADGTGNEWWIDSAASILKPEEQLLVDAAKQKLLKQRKPVEVGRVIAELSFGFWTSLLNTKYEQILWPRFLKGAFPAMPRAIRTRKDISRALNSIRQLRNRVFHHEPIWGIPSLDKRHDEVLESLGWLSPALLETIRLLDRFPEVHGTGCESYRSRIEAYMKTLA